ncbi:MAG: pilus assembly protein PilM [Patescibacteria group bacterium]
MLSALSRVLPPPTYLTMPSVGLDISDTSLKYVEFEPSTNAAAPKKIKRWGDIEIPADIVRSGDINDAQKLTAVLKEFKREVKTEYVRLSLPEERAYLFETEIKSNTSLKEVRGLLEFRLEENVPIPSRDVLFDYTIMPNQEDSKVTQVAVAAYPRETIQKYYEVCLGAGLFPLSFEVEAQAMARAVVSPDMTGAVMLVDFGKTRTGVGIVYKGSLLYTSTIDIGGNQLSQVIRRVKGNDLSEAEVTNLKNTEGLHRGVDSSDVRDALITTVSIIKDELATRMQYWHLRSDLKNRKISSLVLCGGSANLKGLPAYLSETLGVPAARGNVWENVFSLYDTVPPISRRVSLGYATAIGLALKNSV